MFLRRGGIGPASFDRRVLNFLFGGGASIMTKAELISAVASNDESLSKKAVEAIVDGVFSAVAGAIAADGRFAYPGFGTFTVKERAARTGRNPQTGKSIQIAASKNVGFKAAPGFKATL
jgi:DNA-binding protein HU-beta